MELREEIEQRAREIRTDGYGMSIGEVLSLYREGDIDIHPEFQRIFRWNHTQKSKLIESILLGIPIPPIFVSQRSDGVWDVIDGVQRLSTILEFAGEYFDENSNRRPGIELERGEYLSELQGYSYDGDIGVKSFDAALRRDFKRAKLEFRIITKGSDPNAKYDLFQRLNSGSVLSLQEARNCLMVMINKDFYEQVVSLADEDSFTRCVMLTERQEEQSYKHELVLRFYCQVDFTDGSSELAQEYGEYLTDWVRSRAAQGEDAKLDDELLRETFQLIAEDLGEDAFRRFDSDKGRHLGPFSISSYEFITSGVAANIEAWKNAPQGELKKRVEHMWSAEEFRSNSGTGISPRRRVPKLVNASREFFRI